MLQPENAQTGDAQNPPDDTRQAQPPFVPAVGIAMAMRCPKFERCSAAYCPAMGPRLGGKHYKGESVCSYLLESVKPDGQTRLRGYLPAELADPVIRDGLRFLNSTGPLQKPLKRASKQGSRMESVKRASASRRCRPRETGT